jgi:DNA invertase Pin-like site-specific DNA recombinase
MDEFGVSIRFANQHDLDPMSPDDHVIVALSFTLARRESMMTSLRIKGAVDAKRENGGYIGRAPDGYTSVEDGQPIVRLMRDTPITLNMISNVIRSGDWCGICSTRNVGATSTIWMRRSP